MKSISALLLLAFIFGGVVNIYAEEEAVAEVAKAAAPVAEAVAPVAKVAAPVAEAVAPVAKVAAPVAEAVAPVVKVAAPVVDIFAPIANAAKAAADVAHAAVDSAGAVIPGAAVPGKFADGLLKIFKDNVDAFQNLFGGGKVGIPFFNPFLPIEPMKFKRSTPDLDASCINGFNAVRDELFDLLENNILTAYCKSAEGQVDDICARLTEPLGIVGTKTADLVKVVAEYCKNKN